jgi:tetratricopeptide (TPR) repeat protein
MIILEQAKSLRDIVTTLFEQEEFDTGLKILESRKDLPEVIVLECMGNFHFYKRELQSAVKHYEAAIEKNPEHMIARYQYLIGIQEEKRKNLISAFERYQAAIGIEPKFVDPYIELGGLLVKVGNFKGAAQCYRDTIKLLPNDLASHHNLKAVLAELLADGCEEISNELKNIQAKIEKLEDGGAVIPTGHQW